MSDPLPPVDDSFMRANEAIAALRKVRPNTPTEARNRAVELSRLNEILSKATKEIAETQARARVANGNGAQPVQGEPAALSDELIEAVARGTARFVKATIAPLKERITKLEGGARKVETRRALTWICEGASATSNSGLSCDECGSCGPRMVSGPILLTDKWLAIAKRWEEFLCSECVQQRCRERLGRELRSDDLSGCDANRAWLAVLRSTES